MAWEALTDTQALKELAGLRGIAPSVRFLEKLPTETNKVKVYHVKQNELLHLWGVEMFQGGIDCLQIYKINSNGTQTLYKNSGLSIDDFKTLDEKGYENIIEYPGFDDFWIDPYLVNYDTGSEDKKIIKSNFFRIFSFLEEGYYKIVLNEKTNPVTGNSGFVANYSDSHYLPVTNFYARSYMTQEWNSYGSKGIAPFNTLTSNDKFGSYSPYGSPIQAVRTEGEFRREIYIKVIAQDKDICTGETIKRRTISAPDNIGLIPLFNGSTVNPFTCIMANTSDPSYPKIGSFHYKGNGVVIRKNSAFDSSKIYTKTFTNGTLNVCDYSLEAQNHFFFDFRGLNDSDLGTLENTNNMEFAPISKFIYVGGKLNNGTVDRSVTHYDTTKNFYESTQSTVREFKTINLRNSIIENTTFIAGQESSNANSWRPFPYRYTNPNQNLLQLAAVDLRGSIVKNCTFIGTPFPSGFKNGVYDITDRWLLDGCTFENCTFISTEAFTELDYTGVLIKNCKIERPQFTGRVSELHMYGGDSCCIMGCRVTDTGRFLFLENMSPITNNIVIRCSCNRKRGFSCAGEGITIDQPNSYFEGAGTIEPGETKSNSTKWPVCNNMFIMNQENYSTGTNLLLSSYYGTSKFNLSAFSSITQSGLFYLYGYAGGSYNKYNVYMHNQFFMTSEGPAIGAAGGNSSHNRVLNCVWQNTQARPMEFGSYYDARKTMYGTPGFFRIIDGNESNLINNCTMIDYMDKYFFPKTYTSDNINDGSFYSSNLSAKSSYTKNRNATTGEMPKNLTNNQLKTLLNNGDNVIHNLTKINFRHNGL